MILAGDVGGTNFRLALFADAGGAAEPLWRATYASRGADWRALVRRARREAGTPDVAAAAVAVAGPVVDGAAELTNLGWRIS
ncbi:MAG: glucokinase, partial [Planctomycetota bacterium]